MRWRNLCFLMYALEDYLGPRVNFNTSEWPLSKIDQRWLSILHDLRQEYYERIEEEAE